ncbi:MAG TPA: AMP-binding protein, partial [Acidimicrobiales bacterium]
MPGWNFADVWEVIAEQIPDAQALVHGDRRVTWSELDRRADGIAATLLERGAVEQDKVAQYLYNGNEYLESMFAAFKAGLVPINTNYRYRDDELVYLWDNADCVAVVFHGVFAETIDRIRDRVPR